MSVRRRLAALVVAAVLFAALGPAPVLAVSITGVDVELPSGLTVSGRIVDDNGDGVPFALVGLCEGPDGCFVADGIADASGNYEIRGVNPGTEDSYSPANAQTQIFDSLFLKVDSDQAFATAQKHGGDKVLEKAPDTPVTYVCDWNHNTNELVWHVIYGPKLRVAVNASTGEFLRVEK